MVTLIIIFSILGVLLVAFLAALLYIYFFTFYSPHKGQNEDVRVDGNKIYAGKEDEVKNLIKTVKAIPYEDIYTESYDHKKLHARLYKRNSNKVAILCHGYRGTACRDFSGGTTSLVNMGVNVILIDERAHGQSEGHSVTFGIKERKDILSWINKAKEIFGNDIEITLIGISMGGASVLMSAEFVDENIKIIADSPYNRVRDIIEITINMYKLPPKIFYPIVKLSGLLFAHINTSKGCASESVRKGKSKILIIHGNKDSIVPQRYSETIYLENTDKVQYEIFPDTEHGMGYLSNNKRYLELIKNFMNID